MRNAVPDVIAFFRNMFTVVLALALTEAFKQFVSDRGEAQTRFIHWDRLPSLLTLLFLVIPFFHGMSRYFFNKYIASLPTPYAWPLMVDSIVFVSESALFFIMSRCMASIQWRQFYTTVVALLILDSLWAFYAITPGTWMWLNFTLGPILLIAVVTYWCLNKVPSLPMAFLFTGLIVVRTVLDYVWEWKFYFPDPM